MDGSDHLEHLHVLPWSFDAHNIPQAWNHSTGSGITVAIVDTGLSPQQAWMNQYFNDGYSSDIVTIERSESRYSKAIIQNCTSDKVYNEIDIQPFSEPEYTIIPVVKSTGVSNLPLKYSKIERHLHNVFDSQYPSISNKTHNENVAHDHSMKNEIDDNYIAQIGPVPKL